jgi:Glycosyl hydrolase family 20, catalytic domain
MQYEHFSSKDHENIITTMATNYSWIKHPIRAVQLDLARQMETLEFIKNFVDFIAEHHFNTLILYLEARIRTASFPYPTAEESYSPEEISEIVTYCATKNIDIIPVIGTLGHAELFLRYEELEQIAELRGTTKGKFADSKDMFCPSLDATYHFLKKYLSEVTALFPGQFFHAGCDESWDIGLCPLCKERAGGAGAIFKEHLLRIHNIITGKLGKRLLIWDDMFELYPDILEALPKDIIMCSWHYKVINGVPNGHFNNCLKEDPLALYPKSGFEALFCPSDYSLRNITTLTEYADSRVSLGGLLTIWERATTSLYINFPLIAFTGHLWHGEQLPCPEIFAEVMQQLFPDANKSFIAAYQTYISLAFRRAKPCLNISLYMSSTEYESEFEQSELFFMLKERLEQNLPDSSTPRARAIIEDLKINLLENHLHILLKSAVPDFFTGLNTRNELEQCRKMAEEIKHLRLEQWQKNRPNVQDPTRLAAGWNMLITEIEKLIQQPIAPDTLKINFFLPEAYSAQSTKITLTYDNDSSTVIADGILKPENPEVAYFARWFKLEPNIALPKTIQIESHGYGGIGVTFISIKSGGINYIPETIISTNGIVEHPERILKNDLQWSYIGEKDTIHAVRTPAIAETIHSLNCSLKHSGVRSSI